MNIDIRLWNIDIDYLVFQSFDFERTWWSLFQKSVVRTWFDIYVFITDAVYGNTYYMHLCKTITYSRLITIKTCPFWVLWFRRCSRCKYRNKDCTNYYPERPAKSDCNLILDWHFVTVISKHIPLIIVMHKSVPSFQ